MFIGQKQGFIIGDFIILAAFGSHYLVQVTGVGSCSVNGNYLFGKADCKTFSKSCHDEPSGKLFGTFNYTNYSFVRKVSNEEAATIVTE